MDIIYGEMILDQENEAPKSIGSKGMIEISDSSVFRMGEVFDSYEDLLRRLASHSKQSMVHYWRRDSRTVQGAYMKTSRPIEQKLVYYSVKYACVFGGQKFFPRGKGQRNSMTMRTDCPSHIMVRANKTGQQLEVISVCNFHNHPVSRDLYRRLPQDRKLPPTIKQDVLDMLSIGVERKCVRDYVRTMTGKILTNKDLLNLGAGDRKPRQPPKPERTLALLRAINKMDPISEDLDPVSLADSTDSQESAEDQHSSAMDGISKDDSLDLATSPRVEDPHHNLLQQDDGVEDSLECPLYDTTPDPVVAEVEVFYKPNNHKNIIEYLQPNFVNSFHMMKEELSLNSDIIIENIGVASVDTDTDTNIVSGQDVILSKTVTPVNVDHLIQDQEDTQILDKFKVKVVNVDSLFQTDTGAKLMVHQGPPVGGLLHSIQPGETEVVSEMDVSRDVFLIRTSEMGGDGEVCGVPIKMRCDGTFEISEASNGRMNEFVSLSRMDQGMFTFSEENVIVDSMDERCVITKVDCQGGPDMAFVSDAAPGCDACGRNAQAIEESISRLQKEKEKMEKEVNVLRTKREKLRSDIKKERSSLRKLVKVAAARNNQIEIWETFEQEMQSDKIEYVYVA